MNGAIPIELANDRTSSALKFAALQKALQRSVGIKKLLANESASRSALDFGASFAIPSTNVR